MQVNFRPVRVDGAAALLDGQGIQHEVVDDLVRAKYSDQDTARAIRWALSKLKVSPIMVEGYDELATACADK